MHDRSGLNEQRVAKVRNVHYEEDIRYTMQICQYVLQPIGKWYQVQDRATSWAEKSITFVLNVLCLSILLFVLIPFGMYTIFRERNVYILVKLISPLSYCLTSTIKYVYIGKRGADFGSCIRHVKEDWCTVRDQDHREIMRRCALMGRRITLLCITFLYTGGFSYHTIMPLSSRQKINENYTSRPHTYPGYDIFFDPETSPTYEIIFVLHIAYAIISFNITAAACTLTAIFVTHACGQLEILMSLMSDLVEGKRSKGTTVEYRLRKIAKQHVRVLKFSARVEEVMRQICLMELMASTVIICLLEYCCMMEWENSDAVAILTYFIILIAFIFNVLIFCYIGELLAEQYSKISAAIYESSWYDLSGTKALDLKLIIAMSYYPPKLTAGKFFDLTLYTFGSVLRTSLVYLNLVRTVTE